jgi:transglutaminase-like putative cysteine protease
VSVVTAPRRVPLEPLRRRQRAELAAPAARPAVRLVTFGALGLYGSLRWSSLIAPAATGRMLVLLAMAVATGGILGRRAQLGGRNRILAAACVVVPAVAVFPLCGVPLTLVTHLHVDALADGIGQGLAALPRVFVPYAGVNEWARTVIMLGGGLLLLDAAVLLAFVPQGLGDARRAAAALPLIALAIVPATLETPHLATLQGLLLFVLVAAFVWGERLGRRELLPAVAIAGVAGVAGVLLAPGLDTHRPLVNYESFANGFSPAGVETFDWFQGYGPYYWPAAGRQVLRVSAAHPEFWKTENLDFFNGTGWAQATPSISSLGAIPTPTPSPSPAALARWTQTVRVTIGTMYTTQVIAAGTAAEPQDVPGGVAPGTSPGTWIANRQLGPEDAYTVKVYAPHPAPAELASAGLAYPAALDYYRTMFVPVQGPSSVPGTVVFPAFGSAAPAPSAQYVSSTMATSPYAPAYRLARRLAAGMATPYAFVDRVYRYLKQGYTYNTNAPRSPYPIETFLFDAKYGYCQQFAGAMALLVRMGGVPARVAVGFAPGTRSSSSGQWVVNDLAAHAWVEVWFPGYGWVAFDPTRAATSSSRPHPSSGASKGAAPGGAAKLRGDASAQSSGSLKHSGSTLPIAAIVAVALLVLALGLGGAGVAVRRRWRALVPPSSDELLAELERALRRSSVALAPATTLTQLERRFRRSPEAVGYLRALAKTRYAGAGEAPTAAQRRALRAELADGRRPFGRLRSLWALPPRL